MSDDTLHTMDAIVARLDCFAFWNVQTVHRRGVRRYECSVHVERPGQRYRATATTPHDACRSALEKATTGIGKRGAPKLRYRPSVDHGA